MIDEVKIKTFVSLAKTLNFTETANEIFMTQQSVSRIIVNLEKQLNFLLFDRSKHYVALTEEGKEYYKIVVDLYRKYKDGVEAIQNRGAQANFCFAQMRDIDMGTSVPDSMQFFSSRYPEIKASGIRENPYILIRLLKEHKVDVIFLYAMCLDFQDIDMEIETLEIMQASLNIMISPHHDLALQNAPFKDLSRLPLILDVCEGETFQDFNARADIIRRIYGISSEQILKATDRENAYMMADMLYGIIADTSISRLACTQHLISYPVGKNMPVLAIWRKNEPNPHVASFARIVQQTVIDGVLRPQPE